MRAARSYGRTMAKDKPRHETKKPKKKAPKADPATRRGSTTVLPGQQPR